MVSSNLFRLVNSPMRKIRRDTLSPPHHVSSFPSEYDSLELDFADVFGTLPSSQLSPCGNALENSPFSSWNDDPVAIQKRSHSLVGPSSCSMRSLSFDLHELTLHESEEADVLDEPGTAGTTNAAHPVGLDDFEIMKVVGQGAFGKVYQVRKKGSFEIYAMKVIRKDKIVEKNHAEYMKSERDILTRIDHPFIVRLRYSFQTKYRLYLVLDFINGGHLFFQLYRQGLFREDLARIYTAEIVAAVAHLHANGIMHRDLKPENILLDADGHAMLTDFGLAKRFEENTRSNSLCGTVEYMSPEIIQGKGHDKAADWWSVGVLLFEMLTGRPPFVGGNRAKIQQKIIKEKIKLPPFLSSEAHSLLKGLLQKDGSKRLGSEEIRAHKWFRSVNWKRVEARELQPSFRPDVAGKHCIANFDKRWTDMPLSDSPVSTPTDIGMNTFMGFSYSGPTNRLPSLSSSSSPAIEK